METTDKHEELKQVAERFANIPEAVAALQKIHLDNIRECHCAAASACGGVTVKDWAALGVFLSTRPDQAAPPAAVHRQLQQKLKQAVSEHDESALFAILLTIVKGVKPYDLY